jgi:hypothetical protein
MALVAVPGISCDGIERLAARLPAMIRPLIERGDMTAGGQLGLYIAEVGTTRSDAGAVALQFSTDEKLELSATRLRDAGYTPSDIMDETFGRYLTVQDPDGYLIQVNELDEEFSNLSYETQETAARK